MYALKERSTIANASFEFVSRRAWTRQETVSVLDYPSCLRNIGNLLYQCHGSGITVYDIRLKQLNNIPRGNLGFMHDVCDIPNGDLLVATGYGLYHIKPNGKYWQH